MKTAACTIVLVVFLVGSLSTAQVVRTQSGRALDANLRVGSGGTNTATPNAMINSQLYVTGQVSGLRAFHGRVGYYAGNQLRLDLPSSSMDKFRRQSVGVPQAIAGGTYMPQAYYQRTSTAFGANAITTGRTASGASIPRTSLLAAPFAMRRNYLKAARPVSSDLRIMGPQGPLTFAGLRQQIVGVTLGTGADRSDSSSAFGLLNDKDRSELTNQIQELLRVDRMVDGQVQAIIDSSVGKLSEDEKEDKKALPPLPQTGDNLDKNKQSTRSHVPGQDALSDLIIQLQQRKEALRVSRKTRKETATSKIPDAVKRKAEQLVQESSKTDHVIIAALAGRGKDFFNRHMAVAKKLLESGRYYDAVNRYRAAAILNPYNPLAQMGLCMANFAAGEPLTAAFHLRRAFLLLPEMMQTRLEVQKFIAPKVFQSQMKNLAGLQNKAAETDKKDMIFLETFMHHNTGQIAQARRGAMTLRKLAKGDKLLIDFANMVLTGKKAVKRKE